MKRRTLLASLVVGGSMAAGGIVGVPVLIFALTPREVDADEAWREIGALRDFPIGSVTPVKIATIQDPKSYEGMQLSSKDATEPYIPHQDETLLRGAFVWRRSVAELIVYSRSCTDLGCPLTFDQGSFCYLCPCHGGIFNKYGKRLAGPPDRPMYRYRVRVVDDRVEVDVLSVPPLA
jgi:menaquinol-cytochrome c reductase iron-sulfur subunit